MKKIPSHDGKEEVFDLAVENELLMLKLMAEFGAECSTGGEEIHPAIVNEFLKSVYQFEQKFRCGSRIVSIHEKLGMPFFRKADELQDKQLSRELKRIQRVMAENRMVLDVLGQYPDRELYRFITEELFPHEIEDISLPGYVSHFCYEDFHPNHELDIRQRVTDFLVQWFARDAAHLNRQFTDLLVHPDTRQFSREQIIRKIQHVFDAYRSFFNCWYMIGNVSVEWKHNERSGQAMVEGAVRYEAVTESGERIGAEGPFQVYLSNESNWWKIFYFVFPGFSWNGADI